MEKHQFENMMKSKGFTMDSFGFSKEVEISREHLKYYDIIFVSRTYLDKSIRYFLYNAESRSSEILHNLDGAAVLGPNGIREYYLWGYPFPQNQYMVLVEEIKNYKILE